MLLGLSLLVLLAARSSFVRQVYRFLMLCLRRPRMVAFVFALLLFPGVLVHELSHWFCAKILLVSTQGISLRPQLTEGGSIRLGYVTIADGGFLRNAVIGFAPLGVGTLLVSWIAFNRLKLGAIVDGSIAIGSVESLDALMDAVAVPHAGAWLYILLTVATAMLPSPSDRKAWIPAGLLLLCLFILVWTLFGNPSSSNWLGLMYEGVNSISVAFLLVGGLQCILAITLWSIRWILNRMIRVFS